MSLSLSLSIYIYGGRSLNWKSRARAEYKNAEIKVSHAWQVHAMPLRNIKLRQLKK